MKPSHVLHAASLEIEGYMQEMVELEDQIQTLFEKVLTAYQIIGDEDEIPHHSEVLSDMEEGDTVKQRLTAYCARAHLEARIQVLRSEIKGIQKQLDKLDYEEDEVQPTFPDNDYPNSRKEATAEPESA